MVNEHEQYLYLPLFVAIAGSLIVYLVQLWLQRVTIQDALLTEIRLILSHAREANEYLSQSDHYWLIANQVITRAPTDTSLTTNTLTALLPQSHILGRSQVIRVLHFYAHYERCENLKVSLFKHIRDHVDSKMSLTDMDVHLLDLRRARLCRGYQSLLGSPEREITSISSLPLDYSIPLAKEMATQVNNAIYQVHDRLPLSDKPQKEVRTMLNQCDPSPNMCDPKLKKREKEGEKAPQQQPAPTKQ